MELSVDDFEALRGLETNGGQADDETWEAIMAVARQRGRTFQQLADEAFGELFKRYGQPVGLKAALKESVGTRSRPKRKRT